MVTLIHGQDSFSSLKKARSLFEEAKTANPDAIVIEIDFTDRPFDEFFQVIEGQSLFASSKVAFVKGLTIRKDFKDAQDKILESVSSCPDTVNLIIWESSKVPANTKFGKYFKSKGEEVLFDELKKPEIKKQAIEEAKVHNLKFNPEALELLLYNCNYNIGQIISEIAKLALLDIPEVTTAEIRELVSNSKESLIWDLTDAISEADKSKALEAIEFFSKNESDQFMLIPMIGRQLKMLIQIKKLSAEGSTLQEIAKALRMPPFILNKAFSNVQKTSLEKLKRQFIKLVDMDYAIKTGRMDPSLALSLFVTLL